MSSAMVIAGAGPHGGMVQAPYGRLEFSSEQRQMIRDMFANGASDQEFAVLMEIASARKLNPILKQIHFVKRWDPEKRREVWSAQTGIDGFRVIAERTGQYDGQDEPEFEHDADGALVAAKVRIYRKGISRPFVGVARYKEYVQTNKEGQPTRMWRTMPYNQLAKCAESAGFRKAFPEDLSGLYTAEEMAQADNPTTYDHDTGEVYEEQPRRPEPRPSRRTSVRVQETPREPAGHESASGAAHNGPTVNADTGLADDLITGILDAANVEHVRESMQRCMPLPADLREKVLVEGVKRLVDMVEAADVDKVAAEARVLVGGGHISSAVANSKIAPAIRARKASAPQAA